MHISVVIPTFNRADVLPRAIKSVLKQTYKALEIIVVDDGSTDNTQTVLKEFATDVLIISQNNSGVSNARNNGIKSAAGEWIALLDSDDEWQIDKLQKAFKYNSLNPEYEIFHSEEIWIRNGVRVNQKKNHRKYGGMIFKQCLLSCIVSPSTVVFKKSLWDKIGGFDETIPVCEDYDFWLRIAKNHPIGLDKQPGTIKYGGHTDQLSTKYPVMDKYRVKTIEKLLSDPYLRIEYRKEALQEIIKKLKIIINGAKKRQVDHLIYVQKLEKYKKELMKE
ncbi:MAG: glycosyltransferase [Calditrichae bacterium]|nr:glycosyltransferase [Calditrichota bacterium]MCB9058667.1 glycosyltransferase [Calditrichia bacterium]